MIRRRFLGMVTLAGTGGLAALATRQAVADTRVVRYKVSGFTCLTCAIGLETLLTREEGISAAKATYPDGLATITYNAHTISDEAIVATIESMGFHAELLPPG